MQAADLDVLRACGYSEPAIMHLILVVRTRMPLCACRPGSASPWVSPRRGLTFLGEAQFNGVDHHYPSITGLSA